MKSKEKIEESVEYILKNSRQQGMVMEVKLKILLVMAAFLLSCTSAKKPSEVTATYVASSTYSSMSCEELKEEAERKRRAQEIYERKAVEEEVEARKAELLVKELERKEQEWINRLKDAQVTQEKAYEKLETALSHQKIMVHQFKINML